MWQQKFPENPGGNTSHQFLDLGGYAHRKGWNSISSDGKKCRRLFKNTPLNSDSPWAEVPGTRLGNVLSCRKSFHIFMTDGGWNSSTSSTTTNIDGDRNLTGYKTISPGNIDGTNATFADQKSYVASSTQTKIYSDSWGSTSQTCSNRTSCSTDGINTLADLSFYYWATDLRDDIPNQVKPIIKRVAQKYSRTPEIRTLKLKSIGIQRIIQQHGKA